jgi:hypothetical protein
MTRQRPEEPPRRSAQAPGAPNLAPASHRNQCPLLRNGWYTDNCTDQLGQYLQRGEILGAAGSGRISAATRQDCAAVAAAALLQNEEGNRTYEIGGPAFDLAAPPGRRGGRSAAVGGEMRSRGPAHELVKPRRR